MARKKSLQKLLEEYECEGRLSLFDLEDSVHEISKPLCFGSDEIPFSSEPMPEVKSDFTEEKTPFLSSTKGLKSSRRRASATENPYHLDAYNASHIHHFYRCIYSLVDHVKHLHQHPSDWMVRFVGKTDYMPLNEYVETFCTFDTDLISEVISLG